MYWPAILQSLKLWKKNFPSNLLMTLLIKKLFYQNNNKCIKGFLEIL